MILQPQNYFTVVRQIEDHTDVATYYVRAVIRNAFTDEIIDTLDLDDKGGQRFKKDWRVPADKSGQGFYISIVTSVYEDSGYTTKSGNYGDNESTYLVQERVRPRHAGGGVDAREIRAIVKEELGKLPKPHKPQEVKLPVYPVQVDYTGDLEVIQRGIAQILTNVSALPSKNVDLSPILEKLGEVSEIASKTPETPKIDLSGVLKAIDQVSEKLDTEQKGVISALSLELQKLALLIKIKELDGDETVYEEDGKPAFNLKQLAK